MTAQDGTEAARHKSRWPSLPSSRLCLSAGKARELFLHTRVWNTRLLVKPAHLNVYVTEDGAPDPLNYQRLDTAAPQKLHFTVEQRLKCLCFHNYTKMSIYPHRTESMFYTVYLPTTSNHFLVLQKDMILSVKTFSMMNS